MPVLVEVQQHLARLPETIEGLNRGIAELVGPHGWAPGSLGQLHESPRATRPPGRPHPRRLAPLGTVATTARMTFTAIAPDELDWITRLTRPASPPATSPS
jgi:hypothetical protein